MIELAEFISGMRQELEASAEAAVDKQTGIVFKLEAMEIELSMSAEKDASGKVSFKVWGVGAEGGGGVKSVETHKVKLVLEPDKADGSGTPVLSSGRR